MYDQEKVRLDRWLWAARFFKTRSLAVEAIKGGRVTVNGLRAKPARQIGRGDQLHVRKGQLQFEIEVLELSEKRLGASLAQSMYRESSASMEARQQRAQEIRAHRQILIRGRPSKKERRVQQAVKRHLSGED